MTHCWPFQNCPLAQPEEVVVVVVVLDIVEEPDVDEFTAEQTYLVKSKVDPDGQTTQAFWLIS